MNRALILLTIAFTSVLAGCNHFDNACAAASCPSPVTLTVNGLNYGQGEFNFISFGDFVIDHGDTEGRTLIRGNLNAPAGGVSFGYLLEAEANARYSLIVGGNANWVNGELYPLGTGFFVGGTFTGASTLATQVNASCSSAGCLDSAIDAVKNYYVSLSAALAAKAQTAIYTLQYQSLNITCSSNAVEFVSIDAATFSTVTAYTLTNCAASTQFVINIQGSGDVSFAGNSFPSTNCVYNVIGSGKVTANSYVIGSLLAVNSVYSQTAGTVVGKVIVGSGSAVVQANLAQCNGTNGSTTGAATSTTGDAPTPATSTTGEAASSASTSTSTSAAPPASGTSTAGTPPASSTSTSGVPNTSSTGSIPPNNNNGTRPISCVFVDDQVSCATTQISFFNRTVRLADYDVIVFGDLSANTGDIQGRAWVSGSVTLGAGFSFGQYLTNSPADDWVLVAGSLNFQSGSFSDRRALVAGSVSVPSYLTGSVDTPCTDANCLNDLSSSAQSCYNQAQSNLAALSDNVAVSTGSVITLTCNNVMSARNVFTISGSDLSAATSYQVVNCMPFAQWVINVVGSDSVSFTGDAFPDLAGNIIYNIQGSGRTINVNTGVNGAILAPSNRLTMDGGVIHGKVVVASAQIVQINLVDCPPGTSTGASGAASGGNDAGEGNSAARMGFSLMAIILAIAALF